MSGIPEGLRYTEEHEWIRMEDGVAVIGITDYAQDALTDIVWIEFLADEGDSVDDHGTFASVESVKSVSEIYAPLAGTIVALNHDLQDAPEAMNEDAYGSWIAKIELADASAVDGLLDAAGYAALIGE
ncbi:MAG: glycine cleavage system protein GcvH [Candidatus Thalassarchaeaceae archaeon]|jgi:glycine cleavage system H protein|nr:glycine cleavage system protein GcvH [Candidatus Thalassarchaeaceae archaeon]